MAGQELKNYEVSFPIFANCQLIGMHSRFVSSLVDPYTQEPLQLHVFHEDSGEIREGVFLHQPSGTLYPIIKEVPVFIKNRLPLSFAVKHKARLLQLTGSEAVLRKQISTDKKQFSFSVEWEEAHKDQINSVWGVEIGERLQMHYSDTETTEQDQNGKILLDVGCGNGILCKALAEKGATVFGIDYSTSVWNAQERMKHPGVCFLQADLHNLPFPDEMFDIVYSNGVLHHTPNTENAFRRVATKVKKGGRYYVWLYCRSEKFLFNLYLYITDGMRFIVNKLPTPAQKGVVESLLWLKIQYNKIRTHKNPEEIPVARTNMYDTLTPAYKFYHTVEETSNWFIRYGFVKPRRTHLNMYGFGVLGERKN